MEKTSKDENGVLIETDHTELFMRKKSWLTGSCLGYKFSACVYDVRSEYGIDNGHITELGIWKSKEVNGREKRHYVVKYHLGWETKPKAEDLEVFQRIRFCLEQFHI